MLRLDQKRVFAMVYLRLKSSYLCDDGVDFLCIYVNNVIYRGPQGRIAKWLILQPSQKNV